MPQATQSYPQYNPSACTSCQACLNNCPSACIYFDPLFIMSDECTLCEQCIPECPEGDLVLAQGSKLLGKEWQWFVQPPESENPSNPSESESSTDSSASEKDNEQESNKEPSKEDSSSTEEKDEGNSSQESQGESKGDSSFTPTDKAKLEALKNALLSAPPPLQDTIKRKGYKRDRFSKAIHIYDELKSLIAQGKIAS